MITCFGGATPIKLERLAKILPWVIRMSASYVGRSGGCYHYIDAYAGPGVYSTTDDLIYGSPLIAVKAMQEQKGLSNWRAVLIEKDPDTARCLSENLVREQIMSISPICADNRVVLSEVCSQIDPVKDRGLVFIDPKGAPDFELIDRLMCLPSMKHIDVLVNVATNQLKRERLAALSPTFWDKGKWKERRNNGSVRPLCDRLELFHKSRFLIGEPVKEGLHWALILGTNWTGFPDWPAGQFHASDTSVGAERLERISYTEKERQVLGKCNPPTPQGGVNGHRHQPSFDF